MSENTEHATHLLGRVSQGDLAASDELLAVLYEELHRLARQNMSDERSNHTLQATALVGEAWIRLVDGASSAAWESRAHFLRVAARAMRNVLIDHARSKQAKKRGERPQRVPLDAVLAHYEDRSLDVLALDQALGKLVRVDEDAAKIVELRFFAGLTIEETARVLGVSTPTVERRWRVARLWLRREIPEVSSDD